MTNIQNEINRSAKGTRIATDYLKNECNYEGKFEPNENQQTKIQALFDFNGVDWLWIPKINQTYEISCRCRFDDENANRHPYRDFTFRDAEIERLINARVCRTSSPAYYLNSFFDNSNNYNLMCVAMVRAEEIARYYFNFQNEINAAEQYTTVDGKRVRFVPINIWKMQNRGYSLQIKGGYKCLKK